MSINDRQNPSISSPVPEVTTTSVDGDVGLGLDADISHMAPEKAARVRAQRAAFDALRFNEKEAAAKDLTAFLLAFFLGAKEEPKNPEDGETPLSQNENFIQELALSLKLDNVKFSETTRKVRSGEMTAHEAARNMYAAADKTNLDLSQAEKVVAKYAAKGHPLLELIAARESGGNYNIAYDGTAKGFQGKFTSMTVDQVMAWQKQHVKDGHGSSAVGKYQIILSTLDGLKTEFSKKGENIGSQLFDETMQERLGMTLLERRGYHAFKAGKLPESTFMTNLSKEWAALPKDMGGKSFYAGDGMNKAHVNPSILLVAMRTAKDDGYQTQLQAQFAQGGVAQKPSMANLTASWKPTTGTDETAKVAALVAIATAGASSTGVNKKQTLTT